MASKGIKPFGWDHRPAQEASSNPLLTLRDPERREILRSNTTGKYKILTLRDIKRRERTLQENVR